MQYFLGFLGVIFSFLLLKYRERIGDMIGEAEWMNKIGGIYNFIIILAILMFLWSVSALTNTTHFLFAPIRYIIPGLNNTPIEAEF